MSNLAATTAGTVSNTIGVGTLAFGSNTGYFHTPTSLFVTSTITGTGGISRGGGGALFLFGDNTFTGDVYNHFGNIVIDRDANLGAASNTYHLHGGTTGLFFLSSPVYSTGANINLTTARNFDIGDAGGAINVSIPNSTLTLTGTISGTGLLAKQGADPRSQSHVGQQYVFRTTANRRERCGGVQRRRDGTGRQSD